MCFSGLFGGGSSSSIKVPPPPAPIKPPPVPAPPPYVAPPTPPPPAAPVERPAEQPATTFEGTTGKSKMSKRYTSGSRSGGGALSSIALQAQVARKSLLGQ